MLKSLFSSKKMLCFVVTNFLSKTIVYQIIKNQNIMELEITDSNFEELVLQSDKLAMVDFWAEWCGPCRMIAPIVDELAKEYAGKAVIGKVDVDNNPAICDKYGIRNIPTILFFKNGEIVDKQVGAAPKNALVAKIQAFI